MASTYTPIATTTLGSAQATITFNSLGSYTDLILVANYGLSSSGTAYFYTNGNSGTSNFSTTILAGDGSSARSGRTSSSSIGRINYYANSPTTISGNYILNFQNYGNSTTYKTVLARSNNAATGTEATVTLVSSTSAITSITLDNSGGNYLAGSTFTLYGIQAA